MASHKKLMLLFKSLRSVQRPAGTPGQGRRSRRFGQRFGRRFG